MEVWNDSFIGRSGNLVEYTVYERYVRLENDNGYRITTLRATQYPNNTRLYIVGEYDKGYIEDVEVLYDKVDSDDFLHDVDSWFEDLEHYAVQYLREKRKRKVS